MTTQPNTEPLKVGDYTPPYSNCKYKMCDLPGQCRSEGKCHHPRTEPSSAEVGSEGLPELPKAVGRVMVVEGDESCGDLRVRLPENTRLYTAEQMQAYARQALSQQSPATVEGELTDECFAEFLRHALKHAFNLGKTYQIQLDSSSLATGIERHATWAKLKQHTKDTIERALNQRLAVKEGEAVGDISKANWPFPYDKTFKAIGNAVHIEGGNLAISVMNFREAFGPLSTHPVSDDQQAKDAPAMVLFGYATGEHLDKLVPPGIGKTMTDVVALYAKADFTEFEAQQLDALSTTKQEG